MICAREVLQTIGMNFLRIVGVKLLRLWNFLHLGTILTGLGWILTRPYEWFDRHSEDGDVNFSKHAMKTGTNGAGGAGAAFLDLCFSPYKLYRASIGELGESQFDKDAQRFWFTIGILTVIGAVFLFVHF